MFAPVLSVSCFVSVPATEFLLFPALLVVSLMIQILQAKSTQDGQDFPLFALAEAIYMSWFTFELLVRLVSYVECPRYLALNFLL